MKNYFYERNDYVLHHEVNKTFEEILWMSDDEFRQWLNDMRKVIAYAWDELGLPPRVGWNEDNIIKQFNKMSSFPVHEMDKGDNIVRNTSVIGNACNQFFPTMMKTRINYTKNDDGLSIYDHFVRDDLSEKVYKYAHRHFKRDSFYEYSQTIPIKGSVKDNLIPAESGKQWIEIFERDFRYKETHDYWIAPHSEDAEYTGHNKKLVNVKWCTLTKDEINELNIPKKCLVNAKLDENDLFRIRLFKFGQKIFPVGFKAFRISWCQYAVNFPPLTAKYLYEKYTKHIKDQHIINIYDPSSGWGGRILGAMSVCDDRNIHYIGTDPNTDHWIEELGITKYEYLAKFFNENKGGVIPQFQHKHTYEIYQIGSEEIQHNKQFQAYRGKLDLVFTSPPYFAKEAYSEDEEQSYKKFPKYQSWVDGYLRPTLETCIEYLKPNRYLLWNIADAKFGPDMLPLEEDSNKILREHGMEFVEVVKMTLAWMPGGNRIGEDGTPSYKNAIQVDDKWFKYEPIFVWKKPE